MKYNLDEIFKEACADYKTVHMIERGYESCILLGVKITKDLESQEIKIFDPQKSTHYYVELDKKDYESFYNYGWKKAVIEITLAKYNSKLERIKTSIAAELNSTKSQKRLNFFRDTREQILKKYYKLTQKLNNND